MKILLLAILILQLCDAKKELPLVDETLSSMETSIQDDSPIYFHTKFPVTLYEGSSIEISWSTNIKDVQRMSISPHAMGVISVEHTQPIVVNSPEDLSKYEVHNQTDINQITAYGFINITGILIGVTKIEVILYNSKYEAVATEDVEVVVLLLGRLANDIYSLVSLVMSSINYLIMGANLNLEIVKTLAKKPIGPIIGFFCQFGTMPPMAYLIGFLTFPDNPYLRVGLLASGSSPGGGFSNIWTHFLGGSLDLSIMMTFVSTVAALGVTPMWILTLGRVIAQQKFVIPYKNVVITVVLMVVPVFLGIVVQLKLPRFAKVLKKSLTPFSLVILVKTLTAGLYLNRYIFHYITWKDAVANLSLSLAGHLVGLLSALLFKRPKKEIIAISIETAVQNNQIAFLVMKLSLAPPHGDLAAVLPAMNFLLMPIPMIVVFVGKKAYTFYNSRKNTKENTKDISSGAKSVEEIKMDPPLPVEANGDLQVNGDIKTKVNNSKELSGIDNPACIS